jgi:DNA-binding transcriptional ArsR family regulator
MLEQSDALDRAFHALADATRRGILERLAHGPASVSELARPYRSSLAAIHQHIQVLENSGLIVTEKVGRTRTCHIDNEAVGRLEQWLGERRQLWEARFDRLESLLEGPDPEPSSRKDKHRSK